MSLFPFTPLIPGVCWESVGFPNKAECWHLRMHWILSRFWPWKELCPVLLVSGTKGVQKVSNLLITPTSLGHRLGYVNQMLGLLRHPVSPDVTWQSTWTFGWIWPQLVERLIGRNWRINYHGNSVALKWYSELNWTLTFGIYCMSMVRFQIRACKQVGYSHLSSPLWGRLR